MRAQAGTSLRAASLNLALENGEGRVARGRGRGRPVLEEMLQNAGDRINSLAG